MRARSPEHHCGLCGVPSTHWGGTATPSPHSEHWYEKTSVCSFLIEERHTASACSKAEFGIKKKKKKVGAYKPQYFNDQNFGFKCYNFA